MKALEILRRTLDKCYLTEVDKIMEAIAELEALENISCNNCKFLHQEEWCDEVYIDNSVNVKLCFGDNFYCKKHKYNLKL